MRTYVACATLEVGRMYCWAEINPLVTVIVLRTVDRGTWEVKSLKTGHTYLCCADEFSGPLELEEDLL